MSKETKKRYTNDRDAINDMMSNKVEYNDVVFISGAGTTTPGRALINRSLPTALRNYKSEWESKLITDTLLKAKAMNEQTFISVITHLKELGRKYAYLTGASFLLSDLNSDKKFVKKELAMAEIKAAGKSAEEKTEIYRKADQNITNKSRSIPFNSTGRGNNIQEMVESGSRGGIHNIKQMIASIGQMLDDRDRVIPEPIKGNYSTGLSSQEYFGHMFGNRNAMVNVYEATKDPGALTKEMMITASSMKIIEHDCGTTNGAYEQTDRHLMDRMSAETIPGVIQRNQVITNSVVQMLIKRKISKIKVRSATKCISKDGVCAL